ncbi:hypothetical protein RYH80_17620 [Halobaculum sp. MBLA0147]|uniref:hypothetical protein n=1 Tax=Halobaculum sp. MBLA0147 TaxID=3079934 RepID=UPI00352659C4
MVEASSALALISTVLTAVGISGRSLVTDRVYFNKKYRNMYIDLIENGKNEAVSPVETLMTAVVRHEEQILRDDEFSSLSEALDSEEMTDISLVDVVESDDVEISDSIDEEDGEEEVARFLYREMDYILGDIRQCERILDEQPRIQRRRDLSYVVGLVAACAGVAIYAFFYFVVGDTSGIPLAVLLTVGVAFTVAGVAGTVGYEWKHRKLEDELNRIFTRHRELLSGTDRE